MNLITWNIQWGRGVDGRVDLKRIVDHALQMADFDVLCLQEVSRNYPGLSGTGGADQFAALVGLLPEYCAIKGIAAERHTAGVGVQQFGNMIFTRLAVLQVLRHQLPWPADPDTASTPRMALEAVLDAPGGPLRVTTTHLEYYSKRQRAAQIEALRAIQQEADGHRGNAVDPKRDGTPFEARARTGRGVLCGDFNCAEDDPLIARLQEPFADGTPRLLDGWPIAHPGQRHANTVGLHDTQQWKGKQHCFDFFFVSADLAPKVRTFVACEQTQASDHQPLLLTLDF
ncbi:MAG: endonuclease/exonuclease/phosphatase family protein [Burkholderiales bacterium]